MSFGDLTNANSIFILPLVLFLAPLTPKKIPVSLALKCPTVFTSKLLTNKHILAYVLFSSKYITYKKLSVVEKGADEGGKSETKQSWLDIVIIVQQAQSPPITGLLEAHSFNHTHEIPPKIYMYTAIQTGCKSDSIQRAPPVLTWVTVS